MSPKLQPRTRLIAKVALSLFVVFHVAAVFILPNPGSLLYNATQSVVQKYGTGFGIHTTWRFFSPNPLIKNLEYRVIGSPDNSSEVIHRYPQDVNEVKNRESFNRVMNYAMFMTISRETLEKHLNRHLCEKWPKATSIEYEIVGNEFSPIERAQRDGYDRSMLLKQVRSNAGEVPCVRDTAEAGGVK